MVNTNMNFLEITYRKIFGCRKKCAHIGGKGQSGEVPVGEVPVRGLNLSKFLDTICILTQI